ncbi:MAG: hypothetical protein F4Z58_11200 [Acidimicrobiaceae bacterium]|nr:hypothetical protein [Acidimicrobiaceae bacterium]MYD08327.1 hypothetical protein [Acidimicrobiaceae bacterium]MYI58652.1 hypothetical protein [Acidimicrobiaceae bacterium]
MSEQAQSTGSTFVTDRALSAGGPESSEAAVHPDVLAWLHEAKRLFEEAEERLESGAVLPALSSLVAVPPLHGMLMGRCSEMLDPTEIDDEPDTATGLYL